MTYPGTTDQQADENWRRYMADQADQQTRALRRISDNTSVTKVLAIVVLALIVFWFLFSLIFGVTAGL